MASVVGPTSKKIVSLAIWQASFASASAYRDGRYYCSLLFWRWRYDRGKLIMESMYGLQMVQCDHLPLVVCSVWCRMHVRKKLCIYIFIYAMHILIHLIYHGQGYEYFSKNRGLDSGQNVSWAIYKWHLVGCQLGRSEGWHKPPATILAPWPSLKGRAPGQHLVAAGEKVLQVSQIPGFRPPKNKITPYSAVNMHLSFVSMVSCGASVGLFWCISQSPYLYNHYQLLHI